MADYNWAEKRKKGFITYLLLDGVVITGGIFAVAMQIAGYFLIKDDYQTFADYMASGETWIKFFFHATLFGLIMGYLTWWRNEKAFARQNAAPESKDGTDKDNV